MLYIRSIMQEDINRALSDTNIPWGLLDGKTILLSGATGLIGRTVVNILLSYADKTANPPRIVALVRNVQKAAAFFGTEPHPSLELIQWTAEEPFAYPGEVDYVIHCASLTSSKGFIDFPADTIRTAFLGTDSLLRLAAEKKVSGFVYLSSMEVYGTPQTDEKITESYVGQTDPLKVRNCYPEAKRICESLCVSYHSQFAVPATVARLCQTFGPGLQPDDNRVYAEFARCAILGKDIVLHTKGETMRSYVYTVDAARALLLILLKGTPAQAYNIANDSTYCTILEMAHLVANTIAEGSICVRTELTDAEKLGYAPVLHMNLDVSKLKALGWQAYYDLPQMFQRMIADY